MEALRPDDPLRIGPFTPLARIGAGGMGRVYLARSRGGRPVAIKVIRSEYAEDPRFRTRFQREVAAARTVSGLYTASVLDAGPDDENPWLATAYIPGPSLQQVINEHGPLPERSARILGAGIAEALGAIHAAGLIHRDLKPSNIICGPDGPRVIDFGISHTVGGTSLTATGLVVGSPRYASPEQCAADAAIVPASDVFALGGVLVYATTGLPPFGDGPDHVQLYLIVHEQPDLAAVPAALRPIVAACLSKDPAQRPSIDALLDELLPEGLVTEDWLPEAIGGTLRSYSMSAASGLETRADAAGGTIGRDLLTAPTHERAATSQGAARPAAIPGTAASGATPTSAGHAAGGTQPGTPSPAENPSRRRLLTGVLGLGVAAAGGGGAWYATSRHKASAGAAADPTTQPPAGPTTSPAPSQTAATTAAPTPTADPTPTAPAGLAQAWDQPVDLTAATRGAIVQGDLLIGMNMAPTSSNGTAPQTLVAMRTVDGTTAWTVPFPPTNPTQALPAADTRAVYSCLNNTLYAYSLVDGKQLWAPVPAGFPGPAADGSNQNDPQILGLLGTTLVIGPSSAATNGLKVLSAFDTTSKKFLWSKSTTDIYGTADKLVGSDPTTIALWLSAPSPGGLIFVGVTDNTSLRFLKAFDAVSGKEQWKIPFAAKANGGSPSPVITTTADRVYITNTGDSVIHAFDTAGKWKWDYPGKQAPFPKASAPAFTTPVAAIGTTVFASDATSVYAVDAGTGKPLWAKPYTAVSGLLVSPTAVGKALFVEANTPGAGSQVALVQLDPATGAALSSKPTPPTTGTPDVLVAGTTRLFLVSSNKHVLAFNVA